MDRNDIKTLKNRLAEKIRKARENSGVSQVELARRLGVTQPLISRIEKGENLPREETLEKIAGALSIDVGSLTETASQTPMQSDENLSEKIDGLEKHLLTIRKELEELRGVPAPTAGTVELTEITINPRGEIETGGSVLLPAVFAGGATHFFKLQSDHLEPFILKDEILLLEWRESADKDGTLSLTKTEEGCSVEFLYSDGSLIGLGRSRSEARWTESGKIRFKARVTGRISPSSVIETIETWAGDH